MHRKVTKEGLLHNPPLIDKLKSQHQQMMRAYKHILELSETKQYNELNKALIIFSKLITDHFRDERELYMYLELVVSNSDGTYRNTRAEMKYIAIDVFSTINIHLNSPVSEHTVDKFRQDFSLLGKNLLGRMKHEEKHLFNDYFNHSGTLKTKLLSEQ